MDGNILCQILAQRIPAEQFGVYGDSNVVMTDEKFNTPENQGIVTDVMNNYETLAAALLADQQAEKDQADADKAQAILDLQSISIIRDWVAQQETAPQEIKDISAQSATLKAQLAQKSQVKGA